MSKISCEQVKKVARLANLPISKHEEKVYTDQLSKILGFVDQLNSIDTSKVEPTFSPAPLKNVMREDETRESLEQGVALHNAKNKKDGLFLTKGVFDE